MLVAWSRRLMKSWILGVQKLFGGLAWMERFDGFLGNDVSFQDFKLCVLGPFVVRGSA